MSSYFQDPIGLPQRTAAMVAQLGPAWSGPSSRTEVEALQLEYSWIKEFDPATT
jgi:excinuclease ABC subunit C